MLSLHHQQQRKQMEVLSSWNLEQVEQSTPPESTSSSLSCALESSMKIWQPTNGGGIGDHSDQCFGNALNLAWTDWAKPSSFLPNMQGSDGRSVSSGSGSQGASRTPSPFGVPPSSSSTASFIPPSSSTASFIPSSTVSVSNAPIRAHNTTSYGGSNTIQGMAEKGNIANSTLPSSVPVRHGGLSETYSRKVFVGGLPPDIDQDEIKEHFICFGPLTVDWPHKAQSKAYFPPKGYAFILFRDEVAVHHLVKNCLSEDSKFYTFVSSVTQTNKKVQIRPWKLSDSDFIMDHTQPIDPRKTIFIGGVPRPLRASELADIFNSRYGNVCYAGIDCDPELKYPKGAGRVTFSSRVSFMSAVSCRFLQVTYGDIDKKVEVKPYVLDDQICDECHGLQCSGRFAPYFCGNIHCLRYYCEHCWVAIHSAPGTQNHRCFIKENGDRPRAISFFPSHPRMALP